MSLDSSGNQAVDFVWGNFPMQPNTQRWNDERPLLAAEDSHSIALTAWNGFPNNQPNVGRTVDNEGPAFYAPAIGVCATNWITESKLPNVIKELIACGLPSTFFKPATFSGGSSWHDLDGDFNEDGCIFYYYVAPTDTFGTSPNGKTIYGTDMNDVVIYSNRGANQLVNITNSWNDIVLTVFQSHTPSLNTANWL